MKTVSQTMKSLKRSTKSCSNSPQESMNSKPPQDQTKGQLHRQGSKTKISQENHKFTKPESPRISIQMMKQSLSRFKKLSIIAHTGNSGSKQSETNTTP